MQSRGRVFSDVYGRRMLRDVATKLGVVDTDLDSVVAQLREFKATTERSAATRQQDRVDWATLQELLDGQTVP